MRGFEDSFRRKWNGYGGEVFLTTGKDGRKAGEQMICNANVSSQDLIKYGISCMELGRYLQQNPAFSKQLKRLRTCNVITFNISPEDKGRARSRVTGIYLLECNRQRNFFDYEPLKGSMRIP